MTKDRIINIVVAHPKEFGLYGDQGHRYEQAEKIAEKQLLIEKFDEITPLPTITK